jgi:hypothetical protein
MAQSDPRYIAVCDASTATSAPRTRTVATTSTILVVDSVTGMCFRITTAPSMNVRMIFRTAVTKKLVSTSKMDDHLV